MMEIERPDPVIGDKAVFSRRELRVIALLAKGATTQNLVKLGVKKPWC